VYNFLPMAPNLIKINKIKHLFFWGVEKGMRLKLKKLDQKRKGFTLLEVFFSALALALVSTILLSITTSAHLTALNITKKRVAQNIAQATLEDIKTQNNYQLNLLMAPGAFFSPNYPANDRVVGGSYHVANISSQMRLAKGTVLLGVSLAEAGTAVSNNGADIILFNYPTSSFSREITITDLDPGESVVNLKSYSIDIIVWWSLNPKEPKQKIEITNAPTAAGGTGTGGGGNSYTLTYTAGPGGTISGTTSQTINSGGSGAGVTANPNTGYSFVSWSDGSTTNPRTDTNITANMSITANFGSNAFILTYTAGTNGTISGTSPQTVNSGGGGTAVTANPNTGYSFANWSDGGTTNPRTDNNVTANVTVTANFGSNAFTLTYTAGANGTISGTTSQTVTMGASGTTVTAVPATGHHFVAWSDAVATVARTDSNVVADITVTAAFAINNYTLTASSGSNGTVTPTGVTPKNYWENQTYTITPTTGYHIASLTVDGSAVTIAAAYTFENITINHTISATFALNTYILTYTAGTNGTISGTSPQTVNYRASGTAVTATPNPGYYFVNWSDLGTMAARTDTNITANISVTANFAINTYTITFNKNGGATEANPTAMTVNYNVSLGTLPTAPTKAGSTFASWNTIAGGGGTTFTGATPVVASLTVYAQWAINTFTLTYTAGTNGTISGTSPQTVNSGASGTAVTAVPATGYHFVAWSDLGATAARTETNVMANITVTANFAITYFATGGTITTDGAYTVNTFTTSGTFSATGMINATVLVVAGGGGGGGDGYGGAGAGEGGGGAGGLIYNTAYTATGSITVTVGAGGAGGAANGGYNIGANGQNSGFGTLTAIGGGGGGAGTTNGIAGGSGGGAGYNGAGGDADYISPRQGYDGGSGNSSSAPYAGHGGGGAAEIGKTAPSVSVGGAGGAGLSYNISGSNTVYAAGGKGANGWTAGSGGNGTANTGNGGTGAGGGTGGSGGAGIVIIRYLTPLTTGLVGSWKFDEISGTTAADVSGSNNTGTLAGTPTWTSGKIGNALNFVATNDKVQTSGPLLTGTGDFTLSAWVNAAGDAARPGYIMGNYGLGNPNGVEFYIYQNKLTLYIQGLVQSSAGSIQADTWYYVTATRQNGVIQLYINGVQNGNGTLANSIAGSQNWAIGNGPDYTSERFEGRIDEVRVYNKALTGAEVLALAPPAIIGLVGSWKFDETSGTVAADASGSNNTGTLSSAPVWTTGGKVGGALSFDGIDDSVNVGSGTSLNTPNVISVSAWVYYRSGNGRIVQKDDRGSGTYTRLWEMGGYGGVFRMELWHSDGTTTCQSANPLTVNGWMLLTMTFDGTNINMYQNGILTKTIYFPGDIRVDNNTPVTIGGQWLAGESFNGLIDEVQIYNKALTATEILAFYNGT